MPIYYLYRCRNVVSSNLKINFREIVCKIKAFHSRTCLAKCRQEIGDQLSRPQCDLIWLVRRTYGANCAGYRIDKFALFVVMFTYIQWEIPSHTLVLFHRIICRIQYIYTYNCESQALVYAAGIALWYVFVNINTVMSHDGCWCPGV